MPRKSVELAVAELVFFARADKGWFKRVVSSQSKESFNTNEYIFSTFFKTHSDFKKIKGDEFYFSVRCGLLHETQTKNNWIIKFDSEKTGLAFKEIHNNQEITKIIFRENFQRDLEFLINNYKNAIINGVEFDETPACELRENFIAKFNHICNIS